MASDESSRERWKRWEEESGYERERKRSETESKRAADDSEKAKRGEISRHQASATADSAAGAHIEAAKKAKGAEREKHIDEAERFARLAVEHGKAAGSKWMDYDSSRAAEEIAGLRAKGGLRKWAEKKTKPAASNITTRASHSIKGGTKVEWTDEKGTSQSRDFMTTERANKFTKELAAKKTK